MDYHYAKNVIWGGLGLDDTVEVTFDIHDAEGGVIAERLAVKGTLDAIQQLIAAKVQTKSAAASAYAELVKNSEFAVEMSA